MSFDTELTTIQTVLKNHNKVKKIKKEHKNNLENIIKKSCPYRITIYNNKITLYNRFYEIIFEKNLFTEEEEDLFLYNDKSQPYVYLDSLHKYFFDLSHILTKKLKEPLKLQPPNSDESDESD